MCVESQARRSSRHCHSRLNVSLLAGASLAVGSAVAALWRRRLELRGFETSLAERAVARARGSDRARLQHPDIDLAKCIGCGACVRECPEDGVLALAHGQAVVVHGARCVGHGRCAEACPTGAIALTLGDLSQRTDLPALDAAWQAVGVPGLFLAGEITGFALVRTAVEHGRQVAAEVARRVREAAGPRPGPAAADRPLDLLVVGAGPAGLACLLEATARGLHCQAIDQAATVGGTVAAYPRGKLVMTQPMDLPRHGRLSRLSYDKDELVTLWQELVARHELPVATGTVLSRLDRRSDGAFVATTDRGTWVAHHVCLALGRRGTPQRLGVPGEDLPKVAYALLDAAAHQDQAILVVGGGDSAVEAALALAEQPGNRVTVSYRRTAFARLKARNEARIQQAMAARRLEVAFGTVVAEIGPQSVRLVAAQPAPVGDGPAAAASLGTFASAGASARALPNDLVFVFAGGTPPFPLLQAAGVSFDPADRPPPAPVLDRGTGLLVALSGTLLGCLALCWVRVSAADYYDLPLAQRAAADAHAWLRPQGTVGLWAGVVAVALVVANLCYLLRRQRIGRWLPGTLQAWMNLHVATGLAAVLAAVLHCAFAYRGGAGGHALTAMLVVVVAGAVGRWCYAFVPRAQNGRQQELDELQAHTAALAGEWDRTGRGFGQAVRARVEALVAEARLGRSLLTQLLGLLRSQRRLRRELREWRARAVAEGIPQPEIERVLGLAQRSHRVVLQLAQFEQVRGLLASWRWLHRWLALLLALLLVVHVWSALRFGGVDFAVLGLGGAR